MTLADDDTNSILTDHANISLRAVGAHTLRISLSATVEVIMEILLKFSKVSSLFYSGVSFLSFFERIPNCKTIRLSGFRSVAMIFPNKSTSPSYILTLFK